MSEYHLGTCREQGTSAGDRTGSDYDSLGQLNSSGSADTDTTSDPPDFVGKTPEIPHITEHTYIRQLHVDRAGRFHRNSTGMVSVFVRFHKNGDKYCRTPG